MQPNFTNMNQQSTYQFIIREIALNLFVDVYWKISLNLIPIATNTLPYLLGATLSVVMIYVGKEIKWNHEQPNI